MKRQADRNRRETEEYRIEDKVLISTKDFLIELMKRVMKKLTEKYQILYGQEDCIREFSRVRIASVIMSTLSSKCEKNSEVLRTDRRAEEDTTASY